MNSAQLPYLAEGMLILASMIVGVLLGRAGRPYRKVQLVIHLFLSLWFIVGYAFILYGQSTMSGGPATWIPVATMGLTILVQLVTGMRMMASQQFEKALPKVHMIATIVMLLADVCAFIIAGGSR